MYSSTSVYAAYWYVYLGELLKEMPIINGLKIRHITQFCISHDLHILIDNLQQKEIIEIHCVLSILFVAHLRQWLFQRNILMLYFLMKKVFELVYTLCKSISAHPRYVCISPLHKQENTVQHVNKGIPVTTLNNVRFVYFFLCSSILVTNVDMKLLTF